ncbi:MAG: serine/threonine-protein kinase [Myxococcota bacterium]
MTTGLERSGDRLGRYVIERRLAVGGMAELFLARLDGPEAFSKKVVIKRILPRNQGNHQFTKMFLDEARLAGRFSHQNLVQTFELAEVDGEPMLVMEYIDGRDLAALLSFAHRERQLVPIRIAAYLVGQIAQGLHAAHELTDDQGEKLNVIHRDVSPENVLMTRMGGVKVIDFGIAKHADQHAQTVAGTVKGKVAYMSPEQLLRRPLDRRSDVFSLGIVFYELLTGVQCFKGESALQQMMAVEKAKYLPVRSMRPKVPPDVESVVDRMLALQPADRYRSALEVVQAIERLMAKYGTVLPNDLESYIAPMFEEGSEQAQQERDESIAEDTGWESEVFQVPASAAATGAEAVVLGDEVTVPSEAELEAIPASRARSGTPVFNSPLVPARRRRSSLPVWVAGAVVLVLVALAASSSLVFPGQIEIRSIPPGATVRLDGAELGNTPYLASGLRLNVPYALELELSGFVKAEESLVLEDAEGVRLVRLKPAAPSGAGALTVVTEPAGALLKVDGRKGVHISPARFVLSAGQTHRVSAELPGYTSAVLEVQLHEGELDERRIVLIAGAGRLSLTSEVPVSVFIGDQKLGDTPLDAVELATGTQALVLRNRSLGIERVLSVDILPGQAVERSVTFEKGEMRFAAAPWAMVYVDGKEVGSTPMPAFSTYEGVHQVRFVNRELRKDVTRTVEIRAGESLLVSADWD